MSFIPEKTPFVSLPTALKGRIDPYELAVLWVYRVSPIIKQLLPTDAEAVIIH